MVSSAKIFDEKSHLISKSDLIITFFSVRKVLENEGVERVEWFSLGSYQQATCRQHVARVLGSDFFKIDKVDRFKVPVSVPIIELFEKGVLSIDDLCPMR